MPDVFTKPKRSQVMSRIRSRGNKDTELALMAFFRRQQITGWRRHIEIRIAESGLRNAGPKTPKFRVRPDFVFPKAKLAVFVDGCFWHSCPKHATQPKGNAAFWLKKLGGNKVRDRLVNRTLRKAGWRVLRLWEHALPRATMHRATTKQTRKNDARLLRRIQQALARPTNI